MEVTMELGFYMDTSINILITPILINIFLIGVYKSVGIKLWLN